VNVNSIHTIVDDSQGASANILTLTGTSLTGWATSTGMTHPVVTFGPAMNFDLNIEAARALALYRGTSSTWNARHPAILPR